MRLESGAISVDFVEENRVLVALGFDDVEAAAPGFDARRLTRVGVDQFAKRRARAWFETKVDEDDIAAHPRRSLPVRPEAIASPGSRQRGKGDAPVRRVNAPALPPRLSLFEQTEARSPPRLGDTQKQVAIFPVRHCDPDH